jgi:hypothetical protein
MTKAEAFAADFGARVAAWERDPLTARVPYFASVAVMDHGATVDMRHYSMTATFSDGSVAHQSAGFNEIRTFNSPETP